MHAGQVLSDEDHRDGGLRAGRVAFGRPNSLYLAKASLVEYLFTQKYIHMLGTALLFSLAWNALLEHARDRAGSSRAGPILEHGEDSQHVQSWCNQLYVQRRMYVSGNGSPSVGVLSHM